MENNLERTSREPRVRALTIPARIENLDAVMAFVREELLAAACPAKAEWQIAIAVEEIFVNIANYAYSPGVGPATVSCAVDSDPLRVTVQFSDGGVPYNPLAHPDPDLNVPLAERAIGGLGILMAKKSMDQLNYEYRDGRNILTLKKQL